MATGVIIAIAAISFAIYVICNIYKGHKLVREGSHPKRSGFIELNDIPYQVKKFDFLSKDGIRLSAIEYVPKQPPRGTILACHYLGGSKTSIYTYIEPLLAHGFNVVSFDYPNHGESDDRKGNQYSLEDDMRRFIKKLKEMEIKGPYGTFGFSMGASIALSATDFLPEIKAVVIDSGPLIFVKDYFLYVLNNKNIKNRIIKIVFLFLYLYVIGFYKMSHNMISRLKDLDELPVLIIHSKKDRIISYKNAEFVYGLLKSKNAELIPVENGHHLTNRVILGNVYDQMVLSFFEKWLIEDE